MARAHLKPLAEAAPPGRHGFTVEAVPAPMVKPLSEISGKATSKSAPADASVAIRVAWL